MFNRNSTSAKFLTATVLTDRLLTLLDNGVIEIYKYSTSEVVCLYVCMYTDVNSLYNALLLKSTLILSQVAKQAILTYQTGVANGGNHTSSSSSSSSSSRSKKDKEKEKFASGSFDEVLLSNAVGQGAVHIIHCQLNI